MENFVKKVDVKLFYNRANNSYYVQIGNILCMVKQEIVHKISQNESIDIRAAQDTKEMQIISNEDRSS